MHMLLVSDRTDVLEKLQHIVETQYAGSTITTAQTALAARDLVREQPFDAILLYSPLEGSLGDELARNLTALTYASVLILTPSQIAGRMREKLSGVGVFVVETPLKKETFLGTLGAALVSAERTKVLYEENETLRQQMADLKTIERAKLLLVECLKLSEEQAHKYIEREAMERRESRAEVAARIIATYQS